MFCGEITKLRNTYEKNGCKCLKSQLLNTEKSSSNVNK